MHLFRASRGLGLGLVTRLVQDPSNVVIATCRNPETAQGLNDLSATVKGKLHIMKIDIADAASIRAAYDPVSAIVGENGIDILYNNAGIVSLMRIYPTRFPANEEWDAAAPG